MFRNVLQVQFNRESRRGGIRINPVSSWRESGIHPKAAAACASLESDRRMEACGKKDAEGKGIEKKKRKRKKPGALLLPAFLNSLVGRE
ncbi:MULTISPECIES: hypothetical protein [Cupriavidus]